MNRGRTQSNLHRKNPFLPDMNCMEAAEPVTYRNVMSLEAVLFVTRR